jgi:hypothetical protein
MMVAPFDYTSAFGQGGPFGGFAQGIQTGAQLAQMDERRALAAAQQQQALAAADAERQKVLAQQAAMQRAQDYQTGMARVLANPNRTWADFEPLIAIAPNKDQIDAIKAMGEQGDKRQLESRKAFTQQLLLAVESNPEIAKRILDERIGAETDAGRRQTLELGRQMLDISPEKTAQMIELSGAMEFGKGWYDGVKSVRDERRAAALAPFTLRKETAETTIKEAEARLAPDRFLAGLDLTRAQIDQARAAQAASRAAAAASGAEAKRKNAEADQLAAGVIPVDKRPEQETKFRKEYTDLTKGYQEVKSAYGRVLSSQDNAVGDLSLIFGYMKMLDPGSVVREGEFATAQNAAGVPERVQNIYNRVRAGERLSEGQRKAFKGQAEGLFKQAGQQEATVRTGLERIAKGYGLNTANIFLEQVESAPTAPPAPPAPAPPGQRPRPVPGQRNVTVEY